MPAWIEPPKKLNSPTLKILGVAVGLGLTILALIWMARRYRPSEARPAPPALPSVIVSTGTIGVNGSLSQSLGLSKVPPLEVTQVERALRPLFNPRYSKAKDRFEVLCSTSGHFIQMIYWPNSFEFFTVTRSSAGVFAASTGQVALEETLVGVSGQIQNSLWESMIAQGTPPEMIYRFADIFGWRIDFLTEPRRGDIYKMVWKRHTPHPHPLPVGEGIRVRDGDIVCAYYNSREKGELYGFRLAGEYFDQEGNSLRGEFLRAPLAYRRISSRFSEHRFHPILRIYRPHHGIDYSAARGTPAVSIGEGVVISRGYDGGLGNQVRIRHSGSYVSIYGHLMGYAKGIHPGAHVKQGQVVGYVGSTGLSTGPHLHFGFERAGQLINFFSLKIKSNRKSVPLPERPHFEEIKQQAQALFAQLTRPGAPLQVLNKRPG